MDISKVLIARDSLARIGRVSTSAVDAAVAAVPNAGHGIMDATTHMVFGDVRGVLSHAARLEHGAEHAARADAALTPFLAGLVPIEAVAAASGSSAAHVKGAIEAHRLPIAYALVDGKQAQQLVHPGLLSNALNGASALAGGAAGTAPAAARSNTLRNALVGVGLVGAIGTTAVVLGAGGSHDTDAQLKGLAADAAASSVDTAPADEAAPARAEATGPETSLTRPGQAAKVETDQQDYTGSDTAAGAAKVAEGLDGATVEGKRARAVVAALTAAEGAQPGDQSNAAFVSAVFHDIQPLGAKGAGVADVKELIQYGEASGSLVSDVTRTVSAGDVLLLDAKGDDLQPDTLAVVVSVDGTKINVVEGGRQAKDDAAKLAPELRTYETTSPKIVGRVDPAAAKELPKEPEPEPAPAPAPPPPPAPAGYSLGNYAPNQYDTWTTNDNGANSCSLAASMALARAAGKDPSPDEVLNIGRNHGYVDGSGMSSGGSDSVVAILGDLGVGAEAIAGIDKERMKNSIAAGKPVVMSTQGHYWVAEGYDPETDRFNFGVTASILYKNKSHESWFRIEDIEGVGYGAPSRNTFLAGA